MANRALLLGNAKFDDESGLASLKGPPRDLVLMEGALKHPELGLWDEVESHLDMTEREMRQILDRFFNRAAPDDQLLFYYSGHGVRDNLDNLYLCGRDANREAPAATALSDGVINSFIQQSA